MTNIPQVSNILVFPEGSFLVSGQSVYFYPGGDKAYLGMGQQKELVGKYHHDLKTESADFDTYGLSYEIEDEELIAARLITPFNRSAGILADAIIVEKVNAALQDGSITLERKQNKSSIIRAARLADGRLIALLDSYDSGDLDRVVYMGQPGKLEKVEIASGVQGGNSFYFNTKDGVRIALPYDFGGPKRDEPPQYGDEIITYIDVHDAYDLDQFGITAKEPAPHLDPFFPNLKAFLPQGSK